MKKIFITALLLLGLSANAQSIRLAPDLYFVKKVVTESSIINCFAYFNNEKAKLNGRVFEFEYTCVYDYGGTAEQGGESLFYYGTTTDYVRGNSYYFKRPKNLDIILQYMGD